MHYIPLLFLCAKVFSFIYHRELALFLHNFRAIVEARRSTKKVHVVFIDKTTIFFLIYFLIDILFLFYCIWLITGDSWEPGCMLKLLLIHIHSCHICQLLSFVWVFSRLRSRPTPHCDLILR